MYGGVDLMVVGMVGDASGVSAVSTGSQIIMTITGLITGLTMGVTILLGQKLGQKNSRDAGDVVGAAILFFTVAGVLLSAVIAALSRPLAAVMQAPEEAFEQTVHYVAICAAGTVFIAAFNTLSAVFRGMGNSNAPLLFVAVSCGLNIVLDLLLVAALHMGAVGAALATVLSQAVSVVIAVIVIRKKGLPFTFTRQNIRLHRASLKSILRFGSPIALQDFLSNISFMVVIAIMNSLGVVASAGVGIGEKICLFMMLIPMAFTTSLSAFVAQNAGAGAFERARKALRGGIAVSAAVGIAVFAVTFWNGGLLAGFFSKEPAVVAAAADYLKAYAIDSPLVALLFCMIGYCNGHGKTLFTMLQGIFCAFAIRIPFAYIISRQPDVSMFQVGLATPLATVVGITIFLIYLKTARWNRKGGGLTAGTGAESAEVTR
jgi:putative MATE family efflux protein